jgi:hypothetical protein
MSFTDRLARCERIVVNVTDRFRIRIIMNCPISHSAILLTITAVERLGGGCSTHQHCGTRPKPLHAVCRYFCCLHLLSYRKINLQLSFGFTLCVFGVVPQSIRHLQPFIVFRLCLKNLIFFRHIVWKLIASIYNTFVVAHFVKTAVEHHI